MEIYKKTFLTLLSIVNKILINTSLISLLHLTSDKYKRTVFKSHLKISRLVRPKLLFMIISNGTSQRAQYVIDILLG
jgi:hypothetical protein